MKTPPRVVELAYTGDLKSPEVNPHEGSIPSSGTIEIVLPHIKSSIMVDRFLDDGWLLLKIVGPHRTVYKIIESYEWSIVRVVGKTS